MNRGDRQLRGLVEAAAHFGDLLLQRLSVGHDLGDAGTGGVFRALVGALS